MNQLRMVLLPIVLSAIALNAFGQVTVPNPIQANTTGTLVIIPASAEVRQTNDEVRAIFMVEEQDHDKTVAASRVNLKMKQGTEIIRREDPQATLKTHGYYTYPVYSEDHGHPPPQPQSHPHANKLRQPASWRVGQYLEVTTTNIVTLPKTVAAAQRILALNGLHFGLTDAASKKLDSRRIEATYRNLTERIVAVARAMGRNPADAVLDTVDFEGTGTYVQNDAAPKMTMMRAADNMESAPVEEPSFEPGETTLQMNVVGKVRFK